MDYLLIFSTCFSIGLRVDMCCICSASIFPPSDNNFNLLWGTHSLWLSGYLTRSGLPESRSILATAIKEWACNSNQAK